MQSNRENHKPSLDYFIKEQDSENLGLSGARRLQAILLDEDINLEKCCIPENPPIAENQRGPTCGLKALEIALAYAYDNQDTPLPKARKHSKIPTKEQKLESKPFLSMRRYAKNQEYTSIGEILNISYLEAIAAHFGFKECKAFQHSVNAEDKDDVTQYTMALLNAIKAGNTIIVSVDNQANFPGKKQGKGAHWALAWGYICRDNKYYLLITHFGEYYLWSIDKLYQSNKFLLDYYPNDGEYYKTAPDLYANIETSKKQDEIKKIYTISTPDLSHFKFTYLTIPSYQLKNLVSLDHIAKMKAVLASPQSAAQIEPTGFYRLIMTYRTIKGKNIFEKTLEDRNFSLAKVLYNAGITSFNLALRLHNAVITGDSQTVQFFIDIQFNINNLDLRYKTYLYHAIMEKQTGIIDLLLDNGAALCVARTPIDDEFITNIILINNSRLIKKAAEYINFNETVTGLHDTPVSYAIKTASPTLLKTLLDLKMGVNPKTEAKENALAQAIKDNKPGLIDTIKILINTSFNFIPFDTVNNTLLILAAYKGNAEVVELLSQKNNINHVNDLNDTALSIALRSPVLLDCPKARETVITLLKLGADPHQINGKDESSFSQLLKDNYISAMKLMGQYAPINFSAELKNQISPIMQAAHLKQWKMVCMMLAETSINTNQLEEKAIDFLVQNRKFIVDAFKLYADREKLSPADSSKLIDKNANLLGYILNKPQYAISGLFYSRYSIGNQQVTEAVYKLHQSFIKK